MKKSGYLLFAPLVMLFMAFFCLAACTFDAEEWATVTTFAGKAGEMGNAIGAGADARFNTPEALALDRMENLYVGDSGNYRIKKVTPDGVVENFKEVSGPVRGMAYDRVTNSLYVADHWANKILQYNLDPEGTNSLVKTIGTGFGGARDGPANQAQFNGPAGLAVDADGNVYVADTYSNSIRRIDPAGYVSTLAGGTKGRTNGTGTAAQFGDPVGVAISGTNLFVADTWNHCIRVIDIQTGKVETAAGRAGSWGYKDGEGSAAMVGLPQLMAADIRGNVFFTDKMISAVRQVTPGHLASPPVDSPVYLYPPTDPKWPTYPPNTDNRPQKIVGRLVNTVAGLGAWSDAGSRFIGHGYADGTNEQARFNFAHRVTDANGEREIGGAGVAVTARGVIYVADTGNHVIRRIAAQE